MTREEFYEKYCAMCGTQRCLCDDASIASCGHYDGSIEDIPKAPLLLETLNLFNKNHIQ